MSRQGRLSCGDLESALHRHLRIAEDFSLMEQVPDASGDMVIYLGVDADSDEVWFVSTR